MSESNKEETAYDETISKIEKSEVNNVSLRQWMDERKPVNRWLIMKVFLIGIFGGVTLGVIFMWLAFVT